MAFAPGGQIDPNMVWSTIQSILGQNGGGATPNTTTGVVTDNFNTASQPTGFNVPPSALPPDATGKFGNPSPASLPPAATGQFPGATPGTVGPPAAGAGAPPGTGGVPGEPWRDGSGSSEDLWGNPATQDGPDAWFAKIVLAAIGNPKQLQHILDSVNGPNGPEGSLKQHYLKLIQGVMAGDPDKIAEAKYYATNPSDPYGPGASNNGPNNG